MKIMAVDFGDSRTGLAVCDKTEYLASPIGVIHEKNFVNVVNMVAAAITEYDVKMVVVGNPINMDGTEGTRSEKCKSFADSVSKITDIPVVMWDERQTTVQATAYLNETNVRGKKRKDIIDEVAATIILESYMQYRRNHNEE